MGVFPQPAFVPPTQGALHDWALGSGVCLPLGMVDRSVWSTLEEEDRLRSCAGTQGDLKARWSRAKIRGVAMILEAWETRNRMKPKDLVRYHCN